jgi:dGTPase
MLATRERLEAMEAQQLAPYAQLAQNSRGRAYPEPEHGYRTAYQRDRDRILHTTAFRRLEYKTQVFVNDEGDYYRTRLTHTLEVAQVARTLARTLLVNCELTEAIAMAHDLGHTPFGHAGEAALHDLMADKGGFNHNTQGLRIVEVLENRYPDFAGLNLTWEVREGIIKHATDYDTPEATAYEPQCRSSLEGQLINLADEIAYNTHDLDDGLRSGLISPRQLQGLELWDETLEALDLRGQEVTEMGRRRIIRHLVNREVTDALHATDSALQQANPLSPDQVRHQAYDMVRFSPQMKRKNRELKSFLLKNLYRHWRVMRMAEKAKRMLTQLFQTYESAPYQLPDWVQARMDGEALERVVCDYVAGMTDRFAMQEFRKMFDPDERV